MTTEEFVKGFYQEKQDIMDMYFEENNKTAVNTLLKSMNLSEEQYRILKKAFDIAFTDIFYSILLGLEGSASIGGIQETYDLRDEKGNQLNNGDIGGIAYEYFQELNK